MRVLEKTFETFSTVLALAALLLLICPGTHNLFCLTAEFVWELLTGFFFEMALGRALLFVLVIAAGLIYTLCKKGQRVMWLVLTSVLDIAVFFLLF